MPPTPSFGASFESAPPRADDDQAALFDAALTLVEQQAVGVVWLDPYLRVLSTAGVVPAAVVPGSIVSDHLLPLIGLEAEMLALKAQPMPEPLRLANTSVVSGDGQPARRFNIMIFWNEKRCRYLVLLSMIFMQGSPTVELDQEIRRRRLIEQDLAAKSLEYARINQQLEEFAYVISHDLNAPLRALRHYSNDITACLRPASGSLDIDALETAATEIATQTRRMSKMLVDLLDYARIGRVQEAVETVETRALILEIFASLRPATTVELVLTGTWPTIETAPAPLDVVLRNLVENAVKHHDLPNGRVTVGAEAKGRFVNFTVADDGRGIPAEWQSAIFEPFRKIDDTNHPESSGIGLALVKKTVTSLGGTIAVRSNAPQERGTVFVVDWPLILIPA